MWFCNLADFVQFEEGVIYVCGMGFKVGDKVKILDEYGEGVITEIALNNAVMVEIDGIEFPFTISNLIMVDDNNNLIHKAHEKDFDHLLNEVNRIKRKEVLQHIPINIMDRVSSRGLPEIDLHIHLLVDKPRDLSNTEMLGIQTQRLEHFIHDCMEQMVAEFVIIHGVGEGVLRTEIRKVLKSHGNIEFNDADFKEYGAGATYAKIRGLFAK